MSQTPPAPPPLIVDALAAALSPRSEPVGFDAFVARARAAGPIPRAAAEALFEAVAGTEVARVGPDGALDLHPGTHLMDVAARIAAPFLAAEAGAPMRRWAEEVARLAAGHPGALARESADAGAARAWLAGRPVPLVDRVGDRPLSPLAYKLRRVVRALDAALIEREPHARAVLLAMIAGQHALLLGPPGTAKSLLARSICAAFDGARYFEYLLSRFTHPDELFGPVSIPGLKDEDYRRLTEGFLPRAHVAFLDEIFKANSAILNSLLTLVNERVFHHGRHRDAVPLLGLVGASNELPEPGAGLEALYDRFLVRLTVPPVSDPDAFLRIATGDAGAVDLDPGDRITLGEVRDARGAATTVEVPATVRAALVRLWQTAREAEWGLSDRRWRQAVGLLRVAAASEGRAALDPLDLLLLEPCLVGEPERAAEARDALLGLVGRPGSGGAAGSRGAGAPPSAPARAGAPAGAGGRPSSPSAGSAGAGWVAAVPASSFAAQWALLALDRTAPTVEDPVPMGDPPMGWRDRLRARQRSVARLRSFHRAEVDAVAAARERAFAERGERLWLVDLPAELLAPHLTEARRLAGALERIDRYEALVATPRALAEALVGALPTEDRLRAEHLDALMTVGDVASIGLAYRQWRRLPEIASGSSVIALEVDEWLDWLGGARSHASLVLGLDGRARRTVQAALELLHDQLAPQMIPDPGRLGGS